jgi:hypothetical protein
MKMVASQLGRYNRPVDFRSKLLSTLKGVQNVLNVPGVIVIGSDLQETEREYGKLPPELRYAIRSNLTVLSLMQGLDGMPDPRENRARVAALLRRLEILEGADK